MTVDEHALGTLDALLHSLQGINPGYVSAAAMLIGITIAILAARRAPLDMSVMYWAGLCALLGAVVGGHGLVMLADDGDHAPLDYLRFWAGGSSALGAFAGGALGAATYLRVSRHSFLSYADAAAPAVALAYAVARLGCLLNGDDFGTRLDSSWAIDYPLGTAAYDAHLARGWILAGAPWSLPVHPVQLYSAAVGLLIFSALAGWRPTVTGSRVAALAMAYGGTRFVIEFFRGDADAVFASLTLAQCLSLGMILCGLVLWLRVRRFILRVPQPVLVTDTTH